MLEKKIVEYSTTDGVGADGQMQVSDMITLSFADDTKITEKAIRSEQQILDLFQEVDTTVDQCERVLGTWDPKNKYLSLYRKLDELGDNVEDLDTNTMNIIGNSAKQLNKELEDVLRKLATMKNINYDKNKVDFLFEMLEAGMESEEHVNIILDRLQTLQKVHTASPNIEGSIAALKERKNLIDVTFKHEDTEIAKTKRLFFESMQQIQVQLREVTLLQRALSGQ